MDFKKVFIISDLKLEKLRGDYGYFCLWYSFSFIMILRNRNFCLYSSRNIEYYWYFSGGVRMNWMEVEKK